MLYQSARRNSLAMNETSLDVSTLFDNLELYLQLRRHGNVLDVFV
jgi:hypothetical protein